MHCGGEMVECDGVMVQCDEEMVECDGVMVQCDEEMVQCDGVMVQWDEEMVQCDEEIVQCDDVILLVISRCNFSDNNLLQAPRTTDQHVAITTLRQMFTSGSRCHDISYRRLRFLSPTESTHSTSFFQPL